MIPNDEIINNKIHKNLLSKSPQQRQEKTIAANIKMPPIVGVPPFSKCDSGPIDLIT